MRERLTDHMPALRRYALALTGNASDAEDLFQDCMERALRHENNWRGRNLKAWLFTMMTNRHRNLRRADRSRPGHDPIEAARHKADGAPLSDPLERDRLVSALNLIPAESRSVLLLVVLEGYTYAEVAAILSIPIGTVMSRLSRARRQLGDILRGENILPMRARE